MFVDVFGLGQPVEIMKKRLQATENELYYLAEQHWDESGAAFLQQAVESRLEWGYPQSAIYVYKWCVHILDAGKMKEIDLYDQPEYRQNNKNLFEFLNFHDVELADVNRRVIALTNS